MRRRLLLQLSVVTVSGASTFDPAKRRATLARRGLHFHDTWAVFDVPRFEVEDLRQDYGERRLICFGHLVDRLVVVGSMPAKERGSRRSLGSDLVRVTAYVIKPAAYDEMLARGRVHRAGRPKGEHPKRLMTIRLTDDVSQRWRASGPGWRTRMADTLTRLAPKRRPLTVATAGVTTR